MRRNLQETFLGHCCAFTVKNAIKSIRFQTFDYLHHGYWNYWVPYDGLFVFWQMTKQMNRYATQLSHVIVIHQVLTTPYDMYQTLTTCLGLANRNLWNQEV